jgi:hypothetical protein
LIESVKVVETGLHEQVAQALLAHVLNRRRDDAAKGSGRQSVHGDKSAPSGSDRAPVIPLSSSSAASFFRGGGEFFVAFLRRV